MTLKYINNLILSSNCTLLCVKNRVPLILDVVLLQVLTL